MISQTDVLVDSFEELLKNSGKLHIPKKREILKGKVVYVTSRSILVDVDWKTEGVIAGREMKSELVDADSLSVGDKLLVYVIDPEDDDGMLVLSLRRTDQAKRWLDLLEARKNNEVIEVSIVESNNGGLICELPGGIRGFIPTSQVDASRIYNNGKKLMGKDISESVQERLASIVGDSMKVRIIELEMKKNRIILSEKMVTQERDAKIREKTLKSMKTGDELTGQVSGITPFGIFVNAGGVEGLVHLSELSWDKVEDTGKLYAIGQKVKVSVIDVTDGGKRVAYSIKRLQEDPWQKAISKYKVGDIVNGVVKKIVNYGFFVRIGEGLNGLVHISEVSYDLVKDIGDFVKEEQEIKVKILSISSTERHLRLSLKRVNERK